MGTTLNVATLLPGRTVDRDGNGDVVAVTQKYQVLRAFASPLSAEDLSTITGLPAIKSAHPTYAGLLATGHKLTEDSTGTRWVVDVSYALYVGGTAWAGGSKKVPRGQAEQSRGWSFQDISTDLTHDAVTGASVLNSAGDPFESVPQATRAMPVFKRVYKSTALPSATIVHSGTCNPAALVIDNIAIPKHAGKLTISSEKLYSDPDAFTYQYTQEVAVMHNLVHDEGNNVTTDIGWDKAFVQCGFQYLDADGHKVIAMEMDEKTNELRPRATPVLLDELGHLVLDGIARIKIVATLPEGVWTGTLFT